MSLALDIVEQVLLAGSLLLFIGVVIVLSLAEQDTNERLRRIAALAAGALVAVGAQQAGVSYATFAVKSLSGARPASAAAKVGAAIIPALLGVGIGFLVSRKFRSSERVAMRLMGFTAMLATTAFLQVYIIAAQKHGASLGASAIPNIAFVAGILLTYILVDDKKKRSGSGSSTVAALLSPMARRFNGGGTAGNTVSGLLPRRSSQARERDPFAR